MAKRDDRPVAMIVESDEHVMSLLEFMLERQGYEIVACADGRQANEYIESSPAVSVVVLELVLPYTDGFSLIRKMRDSEDWHNVPIIVLSTRKLESDIVRGLDAGANDYVTKPYSPRELMARIRRHASAAQPAETDA